MIIQSSPVVSPKNTTLCTIYDKGNSDASQHYWCEEDIKCLSKVTKTPGPSVLLTNVEYIQSISQVQLPLSTKLSHNTKTVMIAPQLKSALLISIG